jgi:uncharacterized protein (DUF433 family)
MVRLVATKDKAHHAKAPGLEPGIVRLVATRRHSMFDRITSDPAILGGKPIIRGTRISVEIVLEWIASGATRDDIIRKHPHLSVEDVEQALAYAAV